MASTYSALKFELIGTGDQSGTWGDTTNKNLGIAIEEAIVGRATANFTTDADLTLTLVDTPNTQVARNYILNVTSGVALTVTRNLIVPTINKPYIIENNTTGGQSIIVKTVAGTGITVPNGKKTMVYANSTNVVAAENYIPDLTLGAALPVLSGGTGVTTSTGSGANVLAASPTLVTPALGTPSSGTLTNCTFPTLNQNTTGTAAGLSATLVTSSGGTGLGGATPFTANRALYATTANTLVTGILPVAAGGTGVGTSTGTGNSVLSTSPTLVTPVLGTPSSGTLTNCTGYTYANLAGTVPTWNQNTTGTAAGLSSTLAVASGGTGVTTSTGTGSVVLSASPTFTGTLNAAALTTTGNTILGDASTDTLNVGNGGLIKDANGNVGIGTTPSAWLSTAKAVQLPSSSLFDAAGNIALINGAYVDSAGNYAYLSAVTNSSIYQQSNGNHYWSFTQAPTGPMFLGMRLDGAGRLGISVVNPSAFLHLPGSPGVGNSTPLKLSAGTLVATAEAGAKEYDGVVAYFTNDGTSGRGYVPATQIFRLTSNGALIGPTIADYFGASSAVSLAASGIYEIEAYCYFTKTTAGTVTVTATASQAPASVSGVVQYGAAAGGTATGASNQINVFNSNAAATAFGASVSLTTGVNHLFIVKLLVEGSATAGNLRFRFTSSAGTVTPLRGSYYKVTKLPAGNSGAFVA